MCSRRTMAQILGRGYARKQEMLSPTSFAILSSIFSDTRPQQRQGVTLSEIVTMPDPFLTLNLGARFAETND